MQKVRAWDKVAKKYRGVKGLQDLFSVRSDGFANEDYILEYSTGLKDITDTEIFAGDIYREENDENETTYYFVCTWIKECACFSWIHSMNYEAYQDCGLVAIEWMLNDGIPIHLDHEDCAKIRVIGTIHTRPELLK